MYAHRGGGFVSKHTYRSPSFSKGFTRRQWEHSHPDIQIQLKYT